MNRICMQTYFSMLTSQNENVENLKQVKYLKRVWLFTSIIDLQTVFTSLNMKVPAPVFIVKLGAVSPHPKGILWTERQELCKYDPQFKKTKTTLTG